VGYAAALVVPLHDDDAPRPHALLMLADLYREKAEWVSPDADEPPSWSRSRLPARGTLVDFVPAAPPEMQGVWRGPAPMPPGLPPGATITIEEDVRDAGGRRSLTLVLAAPPEASMLTVDLAPGAQLEDASLDGQPLVLRAGGGLALQLFGPGPRSVLRLRTRSTAPLELQTLAQVPMPPALIGARPADVASKPSLVLPPRAELANGDMILLLRRRSL
jgi:hypothetical protein